MLLADDQIQLQYLAKYGKWDVVGGPLVSDNGIHWWKMGLSEASRKLGAWFPDETVVRPCCVRVSYVIDDMIVVVSIRSPVPPSPLHTQERVQEMVMAPAFKTDKWRGGSDDDVIPRSVDAAWALCEHLCVLIFLILVQYDVEQTNQSHNALNT